MHKQNENIIITVFDLTKSLIVSHLVFQISRILVKKINHNYFYIIDIHIL